jgi:hypothetical protein
MPTPYHQERPVRQAPTPTELLNLAEISGPTARSVPLSALASAAGYQVAGRGALGNSAKKLLAPAEPRTPDVGEQGSGSITAKTVTGTGDESRLLQ